MREPLKYLEKNIPDLQKMAVAYMPLGTAEELRAQIIEVALDRAFLAEPLPTDARRSRGGIDEGRGAADADRQRGRARWPATSWPSTPRRSASSRTRGRPRRSPTTSRRSSQRLVPKRFLADDAVGRSCSTCRAT